MVDYFTLNPFTITLGCSISITLVTFVIISILGTAEWWDNNDNLGLTREDGDYCERVNFNRFLREPANALSNLGFIFCGEFVAIHFFFDIIEKRQELKKQNINININTRKNVKTRQISSMIVDYPIWSLLNGLSIMWIGIGSFLFHASLRWFCQTLDVAAIYAMLLFYIIEFIFFCIYRSYAQLYNIEILNKYENKVEIGLIIILFIFDILAIIYKESFVSFIVLPTTFVIVILANGLWYWYFGKKLLIESYRKKSLKIFVFGIITLITGFAIRQLDSYICNQRSFFQMHALFHVVVAISLVIMYLMMRNQKYYVSSTKHGTTKHKHGAAHSDTEDGLVLDVVDNENL